MEKPIAIIFNRYEIYEDGTIYDIQKAQDIPQEIFEIKDFLINLINSDNLIKKEKKLSIPSLYEILKEDICDRYNNSEYWDFELLDNFIIESIIPLKNNEFIEYLEKLDSKNKKLLKNRLEYLKNIYQNEIIDEKLNILKRS